MFQGCRCLDLAYSMILFVGVLPPHLAWSVLPGCAVKSGAITQNTTSINHLAFTSPALGSFKLFLFSVIDPFLSFLPPAWTKRLIIEPWVAGLRMNYPHLHTWSHHNHTFTCAYKIQLLSHSTVCQRWHKPRTPDLLEGVAHETMSCH